MTNVTVASIRLPLQCNAHLRYVASTIDRGTHLTRFRATALNNWAGTGVTTPTDANANDAIFLLFAAESPRRSVPLFFQRKWGHFAQGVFLPVKPPTVSDAAAVGT